MKYLFFISIIFLKHPVYRQSCAVGVERNRKDATPKPPVDKLYRAPVKYLPDVCTHMHTYADDTITVGAQARHG